MRNSGCFFLSGYLMPPRNDNAFKDLKDCHLNHIYIDYTLKDDVREEALTFCDKFDINAIIMTCWGMSDNPSFKKVTNNALKHKSFVGVNGLDEPVYEYFDSIFEELKLFNETYNDKTFYVNMVNSNVPKRFISLDESKTYDDLISKYIELIDKIKFNKTVSVTMYPLMYDENKNNILHPKHLESLNYIMHAAKRSNALMYYFIQTMPFRDTHRKPDLNDIKFQVYTGLAFGAKGFQYFCYRTPDPNYEFNINQYAMILKDGTKTDIYYSVKKVNEDLIFMEDEYLDLIHEEVFLHKNDLNKKSEITFDNFYKDHKDKNKLNYLYSTSDLLCATFKDKDKKAYYFMNYHEPSSADKCYIEFELENVNVLKVISDGHKYTVKKHDGKFSLCLNGPVGALIKEI